MARQLCLKNLVRGDVSVMTLRPLFHLNWYQVIPHCPASLASDNTFNPDAALAPCVDSGRGVSPTFCVQF